MRLTLPAAACMVCLASLAQAQQTVNNDHCTSDERHGSLRQTVLIVDGAIIAKDGEDGPSTENQEWRRFASTFIDASSPLVSQLMGPRERVTIAIANADGSGLTPIFTGCVPLVSEEEAKLLDQETSALDEFFGRDWRSLNEKAATAFARAARLAMIRGTAEAIVGKPARTLAFAQGSLVASLGKSPGFDLSEGLVRYVILSNLGLYEMQKADMGTARANGFRDAENTSLRLGRSEMHFFADGGGAPSVAGYLDSFFLGSEAKLETLGSASSTLSSNKLPLRIAIYQGTADFPNIGKVPVRMRLAVDRNNGVVMSWVQEQRRQAQNVPFEGVMTCATASECVYSGDDVFAQAWTTQPGGDPECAGGMPWGGMRNFHFEQSSDAIDGRVTDTLCVVRDHEETGIPFSLVRLDRGQW